jgi:GT2 family glycosyltransferase
LTKRVPPEKLYSVLLSGDSGYFSICALVIKKSILRKVGYMNEALSLHQDTDFIYRLAVAGKLLPGELDQPVVIRRVHEHNRISAPRSEHQMYHARILQYNSTYDWLKRNGYKRQSLIFLTRKLRYCITHKPLPFPWMANLRKSLHESLKKFYN